MKLTSFFTTNEVVSKLKRPPTEWERISARYTSYTGSPKNYIPKNINDPMKKWATALNRAFSKEVVQIAKNTHEKMLTILGHKECKSSWVLVVHKLGL
jgi:peptidoglycan/xylan/chitin deacetylase (PgdA/CDA1 family)